MSLQGPQARAMVTERQFRPEIEGLRAVAALLIAVYHVFLARVSGGVDVFFVVAGFLVVGSLLGRATTTGRVDVGAYLARLARRLLPNALLVLVTIGLATLMWLPPSRRPGTFLEIAAAAVYAENWALAARSVDYLARDQAASPVQHFWAMSVQGQFYLLTLGIVLLAWSSRRSAQILRRRMVALLTGLALGSFAFSVWLTDVSQPLAYFHTGTRAWEFAVGALLALSLPLLPRVPHLIRLVGGWLGLGLILSCGLVLPVSSTFPGWVALWPVAGAVLVVVCSGSGIRWSADALLGSRPLAYLGGVSYAFYLWHWPALTFYLVLTERVEASLIGGLAVLGGSLALAVLSTRLVESPIRRRGVRRNLTPGASAESSSRRTLTVALACTALVAAPAALWASHTRIAPSPPLTLQPADPHYPGALALSGAPVPDLAPVPPIQEVLVERTVLGAQGCQIGVEVSEVRICEFGDPQSETTILLAGGSHSTHWYPALEPLLDKHSWHLETALKSSCLLTADAAELRLDSSCDEWNANLLARIAAEPPDLIITTATRGVAADEHVPAGYLAQWREIEALGVPILAIRDNPRGDINRAECLETHGVRSTQCDLPRPSLLAPTDPTAQLADPPANVTFLDLSDYFCTIDVCPAVIGNVVVYIDRHHMTAAFASTLAPVLEQHLAPLAGLAR